jgi:hypothetical protein
VSTEREAYMPPELVLRVLERATADVILIGGQALAFWMDHYGIVASLGSEPAVSRDVDFFTPNAGNAAPLSAFAEALGGIAELTDMKSLSALIGSAIAPAKEEGRIYNVDLLHRVIGLQRDHVDKNSVTVPIPGSKVRLRVMHPLDVLQSRSANLHTVREKQDETGQQQLRLAILVAREFLEQQIDAIELALSDSEQQRRRAVLREIRVVSEYSSEDAAKKNAARYGIHLADAIPAWRIRSDTFWKKQWPFLRERMSPDYALICEERSARDT